MKKTLNLITNNTRDLTKFESLSPGEIVIYEDFVQNTPKMGYIDSRRSTVKSIIEKNPLEQSDAEQFLLIQEHFKVDATQVTSNHLENLAYNSELVATRYDFNILTDFLKVILKRMPAELVDKLIYLAEMLPDLVFYSLQPAFLIGLGVFYPKLISSLLSVGRFSNVLLHCKSSLLVNPLVKAYRLCSTIPYLLRPFTLTQMAAIGTGMTFTLMLSGFGYAAGIYNANRAITDSSSSGRNRVSIPNYREGGDLSAVVDAVAGAVRTALAEATAFSRTSMSGVYTEVMRGGVEAYDTMRSEGETAETASVKTDPKS